ncbi:MAG: GNAT family N-acetyltransferase [Calditrichaceae bacterium]
MSSNPEYSDGDFLISADKSKLNLKVIHGFLSRSYWAEGITRDLVQKSMDHSFCFGVYHKNEQIGFARIISDFTTFAYLADVFILEDFRGKGLSKQLMDFILSHPDLQRLRKWLLATRDAHGLYEKYGFRELKNPGYMMELHNPDYLKK